MISQATKPLEVIHSDISGPFNVSLENKRYFMAMVDEYTRKLWIFPLEKRSQAPDTILTFFKYLKNNFSEYNIMKFKTDGANEYKTKEIKNYCKENGISKITSPPYVHELNGKAERINQTIQNSAKTIMHWAGLSENFWSFAIQYACYAYNKIPHQGNNNLIPDEMFLHKKADLSKLRVFGCICHFHDYTQNKSKFRKNTREGIFLGFSEEYYAYIIMDKEKFKINYSTEVVFEENKPANIKINNKKRKDPYFSFVNSYDINNYNDSNNEMDINNNIVVVNNKREE